MIYISKVRCPLKILARRPAWDRSRALCDCRVIIENIRNECAGGYNGDSFASENAQWLNCEHRSEILDVAKVE